MKLSDLAHALGRAQEIAGDVEVIIGDVEKEAGAVLHTLQINLPTSGQGEPSVRLVHGPAPQPASTDTPTPGRSDVLQPPSGE